ncbi:SpoIIE family protein phosphatase [Streptomyces sp. NPDC058290]|uniref:SpoIIE family protein phosphatase n=1 Tax=Streptomyces sp. NPDC058290 TaxID=3346426 RepID=UPI0036E7A397
MADRLRPQPHPAQPARHRGRRHGARPGLGPVLGRGAGRLPLHAAGRRQPRRHQRGGGRSPEQWLPERLLTAVFADLALQTGERTWVNCGHPAPLLIRRHRVVPAALEREVQLPSVSPRPTHSACRASSSTLNSSPRTAS